MEKSKEELDKLLNKYEDLLLSLKTRFRRTDMRFLLELMSHEFLHPEHIPTLEIEIFYKSGTNLREKADFLARRTDRVASVYASENRLVIEPRLRLKDIEELAQDSDIESLAGDILCCMDTLLSRRKRVI